MLRICIICCYVLYVLTNFSLFFFFFNDTATTEIYTLSLHDALPILSPGDVVILDNLGSHKGLAVRRAIRAADRKSTRLNSSHSQISYAVFCLKKKKKKKKKINNTIQSNTSQT